MSTSQRDPRLGFAMMGLGAVVALVVGLSYLDANRNLGLAYVGIAVVGTLLLALLVVRARGGGKGG